jgi:hypothetical protein
MHRKLPMIEVGYQVYLADGADPFGAVRQVLPHGRAELVVNVENGGDFSVPLDAVQAVHAGKVILLPDKLDFMLRRAIYQAHAREDFPPRVPRSLP